MPRPPKVLIVTASPLTGHSGTSITMRNLFDEWPMGRLAELHVDPAGCVPPITGSSLRLPSTAAQINLLAQSLRYSRRIGSSTPSSSLSTGATDQLALPIRSRVREGVSALADLCPVRLSKSVRLWIRRFDPDVIYSPLGSIRMMQIASLAAKLSDAPLLPHFMDDWPSTLFDNGQLLSVAKRAVSAALRQSLKLAPCAICISEDMTLEYQKRFGMPFTTFMNCVPTVAFNTNFSSHLPSVRTGGAMKLVYVGGLHLDRWKTLHALGRALEAETTEAAPLLYIYAPQTHLQQYGPKLSGMSRVILEGSLSVESIPATLLSADVLVHVESFDPRVQRQTRLSISTKIPQYMASGRPILGVGPARLASMRHIQRTDAGVVLSTDNIVALSQLLPPILSNTERLEGMAAHGFTYAYNNHSSTSVSRNFLRYVTNVQSLVKTPSRPQAASPSWQADPIENDVDA